METITLDNEIIMGGIRQLIGEGTTVQLRCKGNSMNPFLVSGRDTLILSPFRPSDLVPGAVILGKSTDGRFLVHRIVSNKGGLITLNGDGNPVEMTEKMYETEVIALMTGYIHDGRTGYTMDTTGLDGKPVKASAEWLRYSSNWARLSDVRAGKWTGRRVFLGFWRRLHPSLIYRAGRE